jgi:acetolactate synthase I/II/III large subunit
VICQGSTERLHKDSHQNIHAIPMFEQVTKWATTVRDADVLPEIIEKAIKVSTTSRPGATVIEIPQNIAREQTDAKPIDSSVNRFESGVDPRDVQLSLELIKNAKKPILLVGSTCTYEGQSCSDEIHQFMDKTGIYGANTFMGKGVISARNPRSLFCVGLGMKDIALRAFDEADLVICIGYDMVEWHPDRWNSGCKKKIIHIDTVPAEVDKNYLPEIELVGHVTRTLTEINERLGSEYKKDEASFKKLREEIIADFKELDADDSFPMKPQRIIYDLRQMMRDDDMLISDTGAHKMWVARQYLTYLPKTCFISNGFCSMGIAMPSAFAAKRLFPEKNVVALCGDGGFLMSVQSLITASRYEVPITVLVWEDKHYGLIKWKQEMGFKKSSHVELHHDNVDLVEIAKGAGAKARRLTAAKEFVPALNAAFAEKTQPTVIVIPVDYSENMKLTNRLGKIVSH